MSSKPSIKVMLISDDPAQAKLVSEMLSKAGETSFNVKWVQQLEVRLEHLAKKIFDVVLVDLSLPEAQSTDTVTKLRAAVPDVPIVVLTNYEDQHQRGPEALAAGAEDYVANAPEKNSLLAHSLSRAVRRSRVCGQTRYSNRLFRALIENATDGVAVLKPDGTMRYYSPYFKQMLGYREQDPVSNSLFDFLHEEDVQKARDTFDNMMQNPEVIATVELRFRSRDGSWHTIESVCANHLRDVSVGGMVLNFRDITDRRTAEEQLRHNEEFYLRLVEHAMDGLLVLDRDLRIMYQSPASRKQFGANTQERNGRLVLDFLHPEDLPRLTQAFSEFLSKPGSVKQIEVRAAITDGSMGWFEAIGKNCFDDPDIQGAVIVTRDITDRKKMEETLQQYEKELQRAKDRLQVALEQLSTPVLQIWNRILAVPLMGIVDDRRAEQLMKVLLQRIVDTHAELAILDVTGVPTMDTVVINHLVRTIDSASLLGTRCVLTGMKAELAQAVIQLGLDTSRIAIKRDLQEGLKWALTATGYKGGNGHDSDSIAAAPTPSHV